MIEALFETKGLCKHYRIGSSREVRALDDLFLTIAAGSFTVLTGPSGSGKTTLLSLLGALERPSRGRVFFMGSELGSLSDVELARQRRKMGFVFQNLSLIANLPVWENVTYPLIPRGVRSRERWDLARELLCRFGMADKLLACPRELSGGEQQRVAIARALAGRPQVILADEPISNLDRENSQVIISLLQEIHAAGKTVVLSVHDPAVVAIASHVFELEAGRIKSVTSR